MQCFRGEVSCQPPVYEALQAFENESSKVLDNLASLRLFNLLQATSEVLPYWEVRWDKSRQSVHVID